MLDTKLILIDGITGSGKSTTAHYLARQLKKNGYDVKWFEEVENGNPFYFRYNSETGDNYFDSFFKDYPSQLSQAAEILNNDEKLYIGECFLFQDVLAGPMLHDCDREKIIDFYRQYNLIFKKLNPTVIHFYQDDVEMAIRRNLHRRGDAWKSRIIGRDEKEPYYSNRNLKGEEGFIHFFQDMINLSLELYEMLDYKKLQIENSAQDWPLYRKQIMDFLELKQFEEQLFNPDFVKYCGRYSNQDKHVYIHIKDNRLCCDCFRQGIEMVQVEPELFAIEGLAGAIRFVKDSDGTYNSFKVIEESFYFEKNIIFNKS